MNTTAVAMPLALVVAVVVPPAKVPLAPVPGAANVTTTPFTGLLPASFTIACSCVAKAAPIVALCPDPADTTMLDGVEVFVKLKLADGVTPVTPAVTANAPVVVFAVKVGAVATPLAFVLAVTVVNPPVNVPPAPLEGAVNVTVTFASRLPPASFTVAVSAVANAAPIAALWGVPVVAAMLAAGPAMFVRLKLAEGLTPVTLAVTE